MLFLFLEETILLNMGQRSKWDCMKSRFFNIELGFGSHPFQSRIVNYEHIHMPKKENISISIPPWLNIKHVNLTYTHA